MNNVYLERDYKGYATVLIPDSVVGEFELSLDRETNSSMGYLLVEPGTVREETIFYHRSLGNTVWFYQVNRTGTFEHPDNSQVLLVNSIDYMNYIIGQTNEQLFLYKISDSDLIIKGGKFYIASQMVTLSDLDTSLNESGKTLFNDSVNYIYIDTENLDFKITNVINNNYFLIATVLTNAGGQILSITKDKVLHIGTIGETGPQGLQGPTGAKGDKGDTGSQGAEVEIRNNGTYIQWKYNNETDSSWRNITSLSAITGADGIDGKEIEMQKNATHIQWRYVGTFDWINLVPLSDIKGDPGSITNGDNPVTVNDKQTLTGTITTDDLNKTVTVTYSDGSKTVYKETGVDYYDSDNNLIAKDIKTGTYSAGIITYTTGDIVNGLDGTTNIDLGNIAYLNKINSFEKVNTFKDTVIFEGDAIFKWYLNSANTNLFNASLGKKQRFSWSDGATHVLNFSNLKVGNNYEFFINVTSSGCTLSFAGSTFTNCDTINKVNALGGSLSGTNSLAVGTHHFVCSTAFNSIHIVYSGLSTQISS